MNGARNEEIVILGGGLAGSSAACVLARAGRPALLLERDPEPRHKVCGEFLSREAQAYLTHLGIDLDGLGASRIGRLRLFHRRQKAEAALPFVARGLSRMVLDEALLKRAISHGARLSRGAAARSVSAGEAFIRIETDPFGEIRANTLFLATGKHDVRGAKRPTAGSMNDLIGFKVHYRLSDEQRAALHGSIEVILFTGGYAGLQMIEGDTANLCLVVSRRHFERAGKSWNDLIDGILDECPHLAKRLDDAEMLFEKPLAIFRIPYGFLHRPDADEPQGLFRLGDQAGVIPSFTGEGMAMALHGGCLAASTYLRHGRASALFHRRIQEDFRRQVRLAFMLNRAARQTIGQQTIFHLCRAWPAAMQHVAAFTRVQETSMHRAGLAMIVPKEIQTAAAVAEHYDELDPFYREVWGEHVHHGLWETGRETAGEAVEALVAHLAERLALRPGQHVCDVGCGYGATAEWLSRTHQVRVTGVTLSAAQFHRAQRRNAALPLRFLRQDWLENTFEDGTFDHVIAIESSEHMPDKQRFFDEAYRTLRPAGRLAVYAWLARDGARPWEERHLLEPICREGRLPGLGSEAEYRAWALGSGFVVDDVEDLSAKVRRTWALCTRRVAGKLLTQRHYRHFLLDARARNRVFALSVPRIWIAYLTGAMRYGLLTAQRPG